MLGTMGGGVARVAAEHRYEVEVLEVGAAAGRRWVKAPGASRPRCFPPPLLKQYVRLGRVGRKTGRGSHGYATETEN